MIITATEYREMGFLAPRDEDVLESCLMRAEYIIAGITEGRHAAALAAGGAAAEYVKQAAGFQARKLVAQAGVGGSSSASTERVQIGDYSYTSTAETAEQLAEEGGSVYDTNAQTIRLLRAAGCLFNGTEVRE